MICRNGFFPNRFQSTSLESPFSQSRNVKFDQCPEAALAIVDVTPNETPFQSPLLSSYSVLQLSDGPGPTSSVIRWVP